MSRPNVRVAAIQPITVKTVGRCPICGYPLVKRIWEGEGEKIDHDLPKEDFPTLESAIAFMRRHP